MQVSIFLYSKKGEISLCFLHFLFVCLLQIYGWLCKDLPTFPNCYLHCCYTESVFHIYQAKFLFPAAMFAHLEEIYRKRHRQKETNVLKSSH